MNDKAKKQTKPGPPKKVQYLIEVEGLIPAKVVFKVMAENEEQAYKIFDTRPDQCTALHQPKIMPGKIKPKKICIRHYTSALITWMRNF